MPFKCSSEPMLLIDADSSIILEMNASCELSFGEEIKAFIGRSFSQMIFKDSREDVEKYLRHFQRRGGRGQQTTRLKLGADIFHKPVECLLSLNSQGTAFVVVLRQVPASATVNVQTAIQQIDLHLQTALSKKVS